MGFLTKNINYYSVVSNRLVKDGYKHVVMVESYSKWYNQVLQCESKYTQQIDSILTGMQKDGYEILDVQFDSLAHHGISEKEDCFHTLITYR